MTIPLDLLAACNLTNAPYVGPTMRAGSTMRLVCVAGILLFTASAEAAKIRLGGISAGYGYSSGWGSGYPGYWNPWWYNGWAHPGFFSGYSQGPGMGEVKISGASKDAMVFLDGAYAGEAGKLKSMWLDSGVYQLEIRDGNRKFERRIYVLSGKTLPLKTNIGGSR